MTIVDLLVRGEGEEEEIHDAIDRWHDSTVDLGPLWEWLGFTEQEWARWVERPSSLTEILSARRAAL